MKPMQKRSDKCDSKLVQKNKALKIGHLTYKINAFGKKFANCTLIEIQTLLSSNIYQMMQNHFFLYSTMREKVNL